MAIIDSTGYKQNFESKSQGNVNSTETSPELSVKNDTVAVTVDVENQHKDLKVGSLSGWNAGLAAGFGSELIAFLLVGTGYIMLCLCNAEISSSLPFAGGCYGLARLTLGLYPGYVIGCCEAVEYILYVSAANLSLASMIMDLTNTDNAMIPLYCLIFYIIAVSILLVDGKGFWNVSNLIGVVSFIIVLIYCFGSLKFVNFPTNAESENTTGVITSEASSQLFIGGISNFFSIVGLSGWFFVGVESLNLCSGVVENPKVNIPRGSLSCVLSLFCTGLFVIFVTPSLPPQDDNVPTSQALAAFNNGFSLMFNIPQSWALLLSIPATFGTAFGFVFAFSKVLVSMSSSALFPKFLNWTCGKYKSPYTAILAGSLLSYILCLIVYFYPMLNNYLYNISILSAFIAYISQFIGFIIFKFKYSLQDRKFTSPLGIYGAVYGILVFTMAAIGVLAFQNDSGVSAIFITTLIALYTLYYFLYARKRQTFSAEEKKIFFPVHIVKFNARTRQHFFKKKPKNHLQTSEKESGFLATSNFIVNKVKNSFKRSKNSSVGVGLSNIRTEIKHSGRKSNVSVSVSGLDGDIYGDENEVSSCPSYKNDSPGHPRRNESLLLELNRNSMYEPDSFENEVVQRI